VRAASSASSSRPVLPSGLNFGYGRKNEMNKNSCSRENQQQNIFQRRKRSKHAGELFQFFIETDTFMFWIKPFRRMRIWIQVGCDQSFSKVTGKLNIIFTSNFGLIKHFIQNMILYKTLWFFFNVISAFVA
jgi:hypothetical protein